MTIEVFLAGTGVTTAIPLVDRSGAAIAPTSVSYRVVSDSGVIVVPLASLVGFVSGASIATVTVSALVNTLGTGIYREARTIELLCTVGGNTVVVSKSYVLADTSPLIEGSNSFQTLAKAEMTAIDIPNIDAWNNATELEKTAALIDARQHIMQLNFRLGDTGAYAQDSLFYQGNGSTSTGLQFGFDGSIGALTVEQYLSLPEAFKQALRSAQLIEANAVMGGDTATDIRASGIVMDNIGESKQTYRDSTPLQLPVCRRALGYLSRFITYSRRIARA